jgi:hypothetical protein
MAKRDQFCDSLVWFGAVSTFVISAHRHLSWVAIFTTLAFHASDHEQPKLCFRHTRFRFHQSQLINTDEGLYVLLFGFVSCFFVIYDAIGAGNTGERHLASRCLLWYTSSMTRPHPPRPDVSGNHARYHHLSRYMAHPSGRPGGLDRPLRPNGATDLQPSVARHICGVKRQCNSLVRLPSTNLSVDCQNGYP